MASGSLDEIMEVVTFGLQRGSHIKSGKKKGFVCMYMYIHTIQRFEMGYWDGGWRCEWEMLSGKKRGLSEGGAGKRDRCFFC